MRQLIYIGQTPAEGTGSPVIVLRHLRRLAAHGGWRITIVAEPGQDTAACAAEGWNIIPLPARRRWWWPPFRDTSPEYLRGIRTRLIARELRARLPRPDSLCGYLAAHDDFSAEVASRLAVRTSAPLSLIVHDDAAAFATETSQKQLLRRRHGRILSRAHHVHFATPELAAAYSPLAVPHSQLFPIPEGNTLAPRWRETHSVRPKIYYAGYIWPAQYPLLARLARTIEAASARLVLITRDTPELRAFLASAPAGWQPPFPTNREAFVHLAEHASALLVSYTDTTAEMPWIATSFPSKFVEYAHLGLPAAIVAPRDSAIARWASRENYPYSFPGEQSPAFTAWLASLRNPITWAAATTPLHRLATTLFSPEKIQQLWESTLLRQTPSLQTHTHSP